jgi:DNA-binding MarR family transcriptional regulator
METELRLRVVQRREDKMPDRFAKPTDEDAAVLRRLDAVLSNFQSHGINAISHVRALLQVALDPGVGPAEYARKLGTLQPVASRLLLDISTETSQGKTGLGLVDRDTDPMSLRNRRTFLTPKGRQVVNSVSGTLLTTFHDYRPRR